MINHLRHASLLPATALQHIVVPSSTTRHSRLHHCPSNDCHIAAPTENRRLAVWFSFHYHSAVVTIDLSVRLQSIGLLGALEQTLVPHGIPPSNMGFFGLPLQISASLGILQLQTIIGVSSVPESSGFTFCLASDQNHHL